MRALGAAWGKVRATHGAKGLWAATREHKESGREGLDALPARVVASGLQHAIAVLSW